MVSPDTAPVHLGPAPSKLESALAYAALSFPVFPCYAGEKKPLTTHGFRDASADPEVIHRWWQATPGANIGIPTAGLIVVDIDGLENPWPSDPAQRADLRAGCAVAVTPRGGSHHVFRQPTGRDWRNTESRIADHVDTRANGGYIVAAPSVTPAGCYRWEVPLRGAFDLTEPPDWLVQILDGLTRRPASERNGHDHAALPRYVQTALDGEAGRVAMAAEGARNATLNRAAYALGQLVGGGAIDRTTVEGTLGDAAARCGLPTAEATATIRSGMEAGIAQPRRVPTAQPSASKGEAQEQPPPLLVPGESGVDVIRAYLQAKYEPTFRRAAVMYSGRLNREVQKSEVTDAPGSDLIEPMQAAWDFPKTEHGPKRGAVPSFYRSWAPVAWKDIMDGLQDEENTAEVSESAGDQFRTDVVNALHRMETFSVKKIREKTNEEYWVQDRRSLLAWCQGWAKPGPWGSVRTLALWTRLDRDGRLAIAVHVKLFGQIQGGHIAKWTHRKFVQFCEQYGVGVGVKAGRSRAVELAPEFLADLLASPVDGDVDGRVDGQALANGAPTKVCPSTSPSTSPST